MVLLIPSNFWVVSRTYIVHTPRALGLFVLTTVLIFHLLGNHKVIVVISEITLLTTFLKIRPEVYYIKIVPSFQNLSKTNFTLA